MGNREENKKRRVGGGGGDGKKETEAKVARGTALRRCKKSKGNGRKRRS